MRKEISDFIEIIPEIDPDEYFDLNTVCEVCKKPQFFSVHYGIECDCF